MIKKTTNKLITFNTQSRKLLCQDSTVDEIHGKYILVSGVWRGEGVAIIGQILSSVSTIHCDTFSRRLLLVYLLLASLIYLSSIHINT